MQEEPSQPVSIFAYTPSLILLLLAGILAALAPADIWFLRFAGNVLYTLIVPAIILVSLLRTCRTPGHPLRQAAVINSLLLLLSIFVYWYPRHPDDHRLQPKPLSLKTISILSPNSPSMPSGMLSLWNDTKRTPKCSRFLSTTDLLCASCRRFVPAFHP